MQRPQMLVLVNLMQIRSRPRAVAQQARTLIVVKSLWFLGSFLAAQDQRQLGKFDFQAAQGAFSVVRRFLLFQELLQLTSAAGAKRTRATLKRRMRKLTDLLTIRGKVHFK